GSAVGSLGRWRWSIPSSLASSGVGSRQPPDSSTSSPPRPNWGRGSRRVVRSIVATLPPIVIFRSIQTILAYHRHNSGSCGTPQPKSLGGGVAYDSRLGQQGNTRLLGCPVPDGGNRLWSRDRVRRRTG